MRHRLYVHAVWTTKNRQRLIDLNAATYLAEHLPIIARQERSRILAVGIVATHVHVLIRLHPMTGIPRLLQRLKGSTSAHTRRPPNGNALLAGWERGYNLQSVSERALEQVAQYVLGQPARHPADAIPGWSPAPFAPGSDMDEIEVASATPAEPSL